MVQGAQQGFVLQTRQLLGHNGGTYGSSKYLVHHSPSCCQVLWLSALRNHDKCLQGRWESLGRCRPSMSDPCLRDGTGMEAALAHLSLTWP